MGKSKFDKICCVDQQPYHFCSGCSDYAKYPRWMESFCSDNCRKIFKAEMDYRAGVKAIDQAKAELLECDLSKKDQFPENLRVGVEAILSYKEDVAPAVEETPAAEVVEETSVEEDVQEISTDGIVDEVPAEDVAAEDAPAEDKPQKQYNNNKNNKFNGYKKVNHKR